MNTEECRVIYKAVETKAFGIADDSTIVCGVGLVAHLVEGVDDFVKAEIDQVGADAHFLFPDDVKLGKFYKAKIVNASTDWETGILDDWDIEFRECEAP